MEMLKKCKRKWKNGKNITIRKNKKTEIAEKAKKYKQRKKKKNRKDYRYKKI